MHIRKVSASNEWLEFEVAYEVAGHQGHGVLDASSISIFSSDAKAFTRSSVLGSLLTIELNAFS